MRRFTQPLFISMLSLLTVPAVSASESVKISGFGNATYIKSGTDDFGYKYDLTKEAQYGGWEFDTGSAFGLQLNANIADDVDFVVQGVFQDRIENDLDKSITWAFLRYNATPNLTFRIGRIATPLYMLSEYRDVGFAYLWTKPITDFYANIPIASIDGADIAYRAPWGNGQFEARLFAGNSDITIETVLEPYEVTLSPTIGSKFSYSVTDWLFSATATTTKVKQGDPSTGVTAGLEQDPALMFFWPEVGTIASDFSFVDSRFYYYSLGVLYETGDWNIQSEFSYTDADWPFFPDLTAGYLSVGKTFSNVTAFGFVSKTKSVGDIYDLTPPNSQGLAIPDIAAAYGYTKSLLDARVINQETLGFGARIDLSSQVALKGQIERTWLNNQDFGAWLTTVEGLNATVPDYIDTYSISLTFVF
ncbi:hypothetical protein [Enterovibrio calviensis]|uniref:hypothetical protein n=1 Tax=Enterovibrio calviensis TaxID=91359 RepID=UPI00373508AF